MFDKKSLSFQIDDFFFLKEGVLITYIFSLPPWKFSIDNCECAHRKLMRREAYFVLVDTFPKKKKYKMYRLTGNIEGRVFQIPLCLCWNDRFLAMYFLSAVNLQLFFKIINLELKRTSALIVADRKTKTAHPTCFHWHKHIHDPHKERRWCAADGL